MYEVNLEEKKLIPLTPTSFKEQNVMERYDIQEWVQSCPEVLGEDLLILTVEEKLVTDIRLDILALDPTGALVIVELKRDESGPKVDWQAIKYASYCSTMTFDELCDKLSKYAQCPVDEASSRILNYVQCDVEDVNQTQRIMLSARDFHSDVVSSVLWLRDFGVDISCVRLTPFVDESKKLYVTSDIIIPLPEAKDYIKQKERKALARKNAEGRSEYTFVNVGDGKQRNWEDCREFGYLSMGGARSRTKKLDALRIGDKVFAYLIKTGYVGYGEVISVSLSMHEYLDTEHGALLRGSDFTAPDAFHHLDNLELCEYVVGVRWLKAFPREQAKFEQGLTVLRNPIGRLREGETLEYLKHQFGV